MNVDLLAGDVLNDCLERCDPCVPLLVLLSELSGTHIHTKTISKALHGKALKKSIEREHYVK